MEILMLSVRGLAAGAVVGFFASVAFSRTYRKFLCDVYAKGDLSAGLMGWLMEPRVVLARWTICSCALVGGAIGAIKGIGFLDGVVTSVGVRQ